MVQIQLLLPLPVTRGNSRHWFCLFCSADRRLRLDNTLAKKQLAVGAVGNSPANVAPVAPVDSPARVFSKVFCVILKIFGADAVARLSKPTPH